MKTSSCALLVLTLLLSAFCSLADDVSEAKKMFEKHVKLGQAFDVKIADGYADDADIINLRRYPTGKERKITFTGAEYKALIRSAMPLAEERGDISDYKDLQFKAEGADVKVVGARYSRLKKYDSPYKATLRTSAKGNWQIVNEYTESQP